MHCKKKFFFFLSTVRLTQRWWNTTSYPASRYLPLLGPGPCPGLRGGMRPCAPCCPRPGIRGGGPVLCPSWKDVFKEGVWNHSLCFVNSNCIISDKRKTLCFPKATSSKCTASDIRAKLSLNSGRYCFYHNKRKHTYFKPADRFYLKLNLDFLS